MLSLNSPSVFQAPTRCTASYGRMGHLDPRQVPTQGQPWASFSSLGFLSRIDLVLPGHSFDAFKQALVPESAGAQAQIATPVYSRVVVRLGDILDGAFFSQYIKRGNILMLSYGRTTVDNVYTLKDGILTLYLDRETYERAGLVGKPHGTKGKRADKPRWVVTYNLRDASMLHGKKGFDRLLYACRNVLDAPVRWLFCNFGATPDPDPLQRHAPVEVDAMPRVVRTKSDAAIPPLQIPPALHSDWDRQLLEEYAADTYEWLSLVRLQSPRVLVADHVDGYICSYATPTGDSCVVGESAVEEEVVYKITWQGFLAPQFVRSVFVAALTTVPSPAWLALSATAFAKGMLGHVDETCVLRVPGGQDEYVMWEMSNEE